MKICIAHALVNNYTDKNGKEVNRLDIQYFQPQQITESNDYKGYVVLQKNVYPNLDLEDFPKLPGIYEVELRANRPGLKGKPKNEGFSSIKIEKDSSFQKRDKAYIVLGVSNVNFEDERGNLIRGTNITFLDPTVKYDDNEERGHPILKIFSRKVDIKSFSKIPGFYNLEIGERRGKYQAELTIESVHFVGELQANQPQTA